ncbi:MAG: sulfite exporter TauE/SafE family protein [Candidatus Marinimicrobia bacterium]|nr:sulfite exporter TauE/SafE family protein [Candidatus Neomarinimicrobiota bacterium]
MIMYAIMIFAGILAGIINTLAGGGSSLTLPVLILTGMPSTIANATNRVAIFFQNVTATAKFHSHGELKIKPVLPITISAVFGSIIGSAFAIKLDSATFDKILALFLLSMLVVILLPKRKKKNKKERHLPFFLELILFFGIGLYGGFVQAGVGFLFLGALNLLSNKDLVKSNAIKVFIIGTYTFFAIVIFAIADKIIWKYGIVLAIGNSIGAFIGVKLAITRGEMIVKIILTVAILTSFLKLFGILKF